MDKKRRIIPWDEIKTEYVTTNTSYPKLGEKYGMDFRKIGDVGSKEKWVEERRRYREEKAKKIEEAKQKESIEQGLAAIREIGNVATSSIAAIQAQIHGAGNGTQAEAAVGALRTLLLIIRDCYGILTSTEQARIELDKEKLKLEREKAKLNNDEGDGIVVSIDGAEEYAE